MLDLLGQTINVGDLVVGGTQSSFSNYGIPHVVTRIGSTEDVQLNGSSYAKAKLLVVCTQQYAWHAGDEKVKELRTEYAEQINYEPVKTPKASVRYFVIKLEDKCRNNGEDGARVDQEYHIIPASGKNEGERKRSVYNQIEKLKNEYQPLYYVAVSTLVRKTINRHNHDEKIIYKFGSYYSGIESLSKSSLQECGIVDYIGQVINTTHPAYDKMQSFG